MSTSRLTHLLAALALAMAGTSGVASLASAHPVAKHHKHHHRGIPQHGGGDADGDNSGGPSDSDGNL
jgi:uncharacterized membrane protein